MFISYIWHGCALFLWEVCTVVPCALWLSQVNSPLLLCTKTSILRLSTHLSTTTCCCMSATLTMPCSCHAALPLSCYFAFACFAFVILLDLPLLCCFGTTMLVCHCHSALPLSCYFTYMYIMLLAFVILLQMCLVALPRSYAALLLLCSFDLSSGFTVTILSFNSHAALPV